MLQTILMAQILKSSLLSFQSTFAISEISLTGQIHRYVRLKQI